jgi:MFS superfamily sulfate permease-like transporter
VPCWCRKVWPTLNWPGCPPLPVCTRRFSGQYQQFQNGRGRAVWCSNPADRRRGQFTGPGYAAFCPRSGEKYAQPALAAIVITASISLFDLKGLGRLFTQRKSEFILAVVCAPSVILVGVLEGIIIAVIVAILQFFERAWRPYTAVLGKPTGVDGYHDITRYPEATQIPGLLMIRWDAPLFFANANIFRKKLRDLLAEMDPKPYWVLVAAEPVTDVDTTAAEILVDLDEEMNARNIHLVFAELKDPVKDKIVRYGLLETIDYRHFYPTLETAVAAFYQEFPANETTS